MQTLLKNQNGFSMVQVLVGFAMVGVFAAAMINMVQTQNKTARGANGKNEAQMIANVMNEILRDSNSCAASVRNVSPTPPNLTTELNLTKIIRSKRKPDGTFEFIDFYEAGKTYGGLVKIVSLKIRPFLPGDLGPGHKFVANFEIAGDVLGAKHINKTLDFSYEPTPSMALAAYPFSCSAELEGASIPRCRLCLQLIDEGCGSGAGPINCSPWVNQPNTKFWTNWTSDSDRYDPDCTRIAIECQ